MPQRAGPIAVPGGFGVDVGNQGPGVDDVSPYLSCEGGQVTPLANPGRHRPRPGHVQPVGK